MLSSGGIEFIELDLKCAFFLLVGDFKASRNRLFLILL